MHIIAIPSPNIPINPINGALKYVISNSILYRYHTMLGKNLNPIAIPISPPIKHADNAYKQYFASICALLYPSAFNVPISVLSSSTILVIDVKLIRIATI